MHDSTYPHWSMTHLEWSEIGLFIVLVVLIAVMVTRYYWSRRHVRIPAHAGADRTGNRWLAIPEVQLMIIGLPLELLWEVAQFPLYTVWHEGNWSYILYGLVHCTLGDIMILVVVYWLVAILFASRYWVRSASLPQVVVFTLFGLAYTIFSEIVNTRIKGTWGYTELMPIVPVVEVGGMPFMQWLLIPPVLIWMISLMRWAKAG